MAEAMALYYRSLETAPILLRKGNISGNINCHDGTVIFFIKTSKFITKLAWALFTLNITTS
jgi:hypothetical protein